ncbi:MAG: hypothetical protein A2Z25_02940 [Planctomycetes bacterium RBG_16_55_9]|nr:MAG: hypothetical protein A2Z25_02940 [Planctomycetes bacterium RBG_16_55_9]
MTIEFTCPKCKAVIAFGDKHRGKRAHCTSCQQHFIVPLKSHEKAKKVRLPEERGEPIPGYYKAALADNWKLFTDSENVTGLVFIAVAVCIKFFTARMNYTMVIPGRSLTFEFPLPIGSILNVAAWGFLFWYYMEIIYATAYEQEKLPKVVVGGASGLIWRIVKSVYALFIILLVVELPYVIAYVISKHLEAEWPVLLRVLMFGGFFLLPAAILTAAVGRDLTMLRPDYFLIPIYRAFKPYLVPAAFLGAAAALHLFASQYAGQSPAVLVGHLLLNLLVQVFALMSMRSIGLFFRHYGCHLPW